MLLSQTKIESFLEFSEKYQTLSFFSSEMKAKELKTIFSCLSGSEL
jgi:hypothetical protein